MGLEYPYLALVSFMLFATMIVSLVGVQLWIQYQLSRIPQLEGFAEYVSVNSTYAEVAVTIRLTRGDPIKYQRVMIATEKGVVEINGTSAVTIGNSTLWVTLEKFSGTLHTGQEGKIVIHISNPNKLFRPNKEYGLHVFFDLGMIHCTFMP